MIQSPISRSHGTSDAIVRFRDVSKTYDGVNVVVKSLDLDVIRGQFLTLLGPSGSGKTTSLMMLAGFEEPTSGDIALDGASVSKVPPHKRDIGVVFQNYALFPHMTVAQNIGFPLQIRKVERSEIQRRVARALEMVRLPGYGDRKPAQVSGGQQQRIALARALVFEPKIILMDEPLGALDRQLREEMQLEIRSLHEALGLTVVYVTHDQSEALTMSDKIAVFDKGIVAQLASPRDLYEAPATAFVARFVGENNCFGARTVRVGDNSCEVEVPGTGTVKAQPRDITAGVDKATLTIRPEKVAVVAKGAQISKDVTLPATIKEVIYLGDHFRLIARLAGEQLITAKISEADAINSFSPGDQVLVGWNAANAFAFRPEE